MTGMAYATSAEMAEKLGAFAGYEKNREPMLRVMRNHRRAAYGEKDGYEQVAIAAGAARPRLPTRRRQREGSLTGARQGRLGQAPSSSARSTATATRRPP